MIDGKTLALIGTNWGRIYPWIIRQQGYEIDIVLGRDADKTRNVAFEEGIPIHTICIGDLDKADAIIIASPQETHAAFLQRFAGKSILCEKPIFGRFLPETEIPVEDRSGVFVNYAFPQLASAKVIRDFLTTTGATATDIALNIGSNFKGDRTTVDWFMEVVVHELFFLNFLFSPFAIRRWTDVSGKICAEMKNTKGQNLRICYEKIKEEGIDVSISIKTGKGTIALQGGYRPELQWNFLPVTLDTHTISEGEFSRGRDIWSIANEKNISLFLNIVAGNISRCNAVAQGLAGYAEAFAVEKRSYANAGLPVISQRHMRRCGSAP